MQAQAVWLAPPDATPEQRAAEEWSERLDELLERVGTQFFSRSDLRHRAQKYVRSLLGGVHRVDADFRTTADNSAFWLQQHLLGRSVWDSDELRDYIQRYVVNGLADSSGSGVLVLDEAAFRKKGNASAGVARQYAEALGGAVSCQVGVMAFWSTRIGTALVDRELYLPPEWDTDQERRQRAHIPDAVGHVPKQELVRRIVEHFLERAPRTASAGAWIVADTRLGCDRELRAFLEERGVPHMVGIPPYHSVLPHPGWRRVSRLVQRYAEDRDWGRLPVDTEPVDAGRPWEWWVRRIPSDPEPRQSAARQMARWLIVCRRAGDSQPRRYFIARGPADVPLDDLAAVVAAWRNSRGALAAAVERCGLEAYRVRSWHGWYRHVTLAQLAVAFLAVQAGGHACGEREQDLLPGRR
ncbi:MULTISPECIES: IS701 family transposase [unclassified Streptomyces]|uniref:IS701 family transposase n=1 Tax=unclassified Streptomyces TaxID=2593676 RepID=UPI0036FAD87E